MNKTVLETPSAEECKSIIFEISGTEIDSDIASDLRYLYPNSVKNSPIFE